MRSISNDKVHRSVKLELNSELSKKDLELLQLLIKGYMPEGTDFLAAEDKGQAIVYTVKQKDKCIGITIDMDLVRYFKDPKVSPEESRRQKKKKPSEEKSVARYQAFTPHQSAGGGQGSIHIAGQFRFLEVEDRLTFRQNKGDRLVKRIVSKLEKIELSLPISSDKEEKSILEKAGDRVAKFFSPKKDKQESKAPQALEKKEKRVQNTFEELKKEVRERIQLEKACLEKETKNPVFLTHESQSDQEKEIALEYLKIMRRHPGINLASLMSHSDFTNEYTFSDRVHIALKIARDLEQRFHKNDIIHYDLKPANIIIDVKNGNVQTKIVDLDFITQKRNRLVQFFREPKCQGTTKYMAPELFNQKGNEARAIDIYSLGVIFEDLFKRHLNEKPSESEADDPLVKEAFELRNNKIRSLIDKMREDSQSKRPDIQAIISELENLENNFIIALDLRRMILRIEGISRNELSYNPSEKKNQARSHFVIQLDQLKDQLHNDIKQEKFSRENYEMRYKQLLELFKDNHELLAARQKIKSIKTETLYANASYLTKFFNGLTRPLSFLIFSLVNLAKKQTSVRQELFYQHGFFYSQSAKRLCEARRQCEKLQEEVERNSYLASKPNLPTFSR